MTAGSGSYRLPIITGCLGVIAALSAAWPAYRAFLNIEIDSNEAWNAYYADAALGRMPLYPSRDRLIANNYPPLSFYIVGTVGKLIGDPLLAGRLLSLGAVAATAGGVVVAIRRLGGNAAAAGIGATYYTATMCRFFDSYVGMNDPHLLAQAVMTFAFVAFLGAMARDRGYAAPVLWMVAAGFIKHNVIVMPLTAMVWLAVHRRAQLVKSGLLAAGAIGMGLALCFVVFGADFFVNLASPRALRWRLAFGALGHLQWVAVGLVGWLNLGVMRRDDPGVRFCNVLVALGLLSFFVQKAGDGVGPNAQFELVVGVSVGVGLAFTHAPSLPLARRYSAEALRFAFVLAICVRLVASARLEPVRWWADPRFRAEIAAREAAMSATVARIRATPGDVASGSLACYRAGKPFVLDPFTSQQRMVAGQLPRDAIAQRVASGRWAVVEEDALLRWATELGAAADLRGR